MCFEDADVVAFMDTQPVNAGHVLVVPREHFESLEDIPHRLAMHLYEVAMELAPVVKQVAGAAGMNVVVNSGAAAGQDVFHYHVHVIPRKAGDGFDIPLPFPGSEMPDRTILDMNAARIIAAFRDPVASKVRKERRTGDRRGPGGS
jgi:histidine triad (HIT) family protein